ncbi:hypothetical protein D3C87_478020 [compost metagenome]
MTAFDALMPGATEALRGGAGSPRGGSAGDWRQAVERAQARSWLADRNTTGGGRQQSDSDVLPLAESVPARASHMPDSLGLDGRGAESPPVAGVHRPESEAPAPRPVRLRTPLSSVIPAFAVTPMAPSKPVATNVAEFAAAMTQMASPLATRPRKQSLHVEVNGQGITVWVRDTSMNSQQANHLAASIAADLGDGEQRLAALYLNGRPLADGRSSTSPSLSSSSHPE